MRQNKVDPMDARPDGVSVQATLSPNLSAALAQLAHRDGLSTDAFVSVLINEALARRLLTRGFKPPD
jgi:hypothetical protein